MCVLTNHPRDHEESEGWFLQLRCWRTSQLYAWVQLTSLLHPLSCVNRLQFMQYAWTGSFTTILVRVRTRENLGNWTNQPAKWFEIYLNLDCSCMYKVIDQFFFFKWLNKLLFVTLINRFSIIIRCIFDWKEIVYILCITKIMINININDKFENIFVRFYR